MKKLILIALLIVLPGCASTNFELYKTQKEMEAQKNFNAENWKKAEGFFNQLAAKVAKLEDENKTGTHTTSAVCDKEHPCEPTPEDANGKNNDNH